VLERLDGGEPETQLERAPEDVFPRVRATAAHPEAYLALEPGLHYVERGELVLAWQRRGRTAFGVGGVNAPEGLQEPLLRGFREETLGRGVVRQLLFPLRAHEREAALAAGFQSLQVGVEAWLDLPDLHFRGNRFENVRQMRNRARRRGVAVRERDVTQPALRAELAALHDAWLESKRPSWRMKLLVGSPALEQPFDRRYFVAETDGRVEGFVTVVPADDGRWGVDVMCRRPDAVPGTMELMLVEVVAALRGEGARALSLGPCPMAGVARDGAYPLLRWIFDLLFRSQLGNRIFGFRALYAFKSKFRPRWEPVYLAASPSLGWVTLYRGCRMWGLY
jgi:lysylphosphatidylglycerol synthetase-like protein (DUF2156 family)